MKAISLIIIALLLTPSVWAGEPRTFTNADLEEKWGGDTITEPEVTTPTTKQLTSGDIQREYAYKEQMIYYNYKIGVANDNKQYETQFAYEQKRNELKLQIINYYGQLPDWWKTEN